MQMHARLQYFAKFAAHIRSFTGLAQHINNHRYSNIIIIIRVKWTVTGVAQPSLPVRLLKMIVVCSVVDQSKTRRSLINSNSHFTSAKSDVSALQK